ncbi:hypothetical protein [Streptomyces sp. MMBL 11-1]|uniref:hypothetical protein n=1 Tax=Streptomyces sp. MMBL 11-1 TaxID=3026420 RepID=UPI002361EDBC|nr:hypothetical protein [Streptomyces sp. MMBL 11-1]
MPQLQQLAGVDGGGAARPRARHAAAGGLLHWRFEADGTDALAHYAGELSYLGLTVKEFAGGLLAVRRLLAVPCVYWTTRPQGLPVRPGGRRPGPWRTPRRPSGTIAVCEALAESPLSSPRSSRTTA